MKRWMLLPLALVAASCQADSSTSRSIITGYSPGWANADGSGFAADLAHEFLRIDQGNFQFTVLPMRRAFEMMKNGLTACTMGGDAAAMKNLPPFAQIFSQPFRHGGLAIYVRAGLEPPQTLEQARALKLGLESGFDFRQVLEQLPNVVREASSPEAQLRKMAIGRIDGYVGVFPPSRSVAGLVAFNRKMLLSEFSDTLHCAPSEENAALLRRFDQFLVEHARSGKLQKTFERYFDPAAWIAP